MSRKIAEQWIREACNDYEMGEVLLETKKYNGATFHSQQRAEKALKFLWYFYDL
ncbi:MAG: HEPN domain-containing protein [Candidatus Lokiarchaeota archaeon]|nr:HEPN domain-containing protein [Candidatus Lokiarchaeota archaeon]